MKGERSPVAEPTSTESPQSEAQIIEFEAWRREFKEIKRGIYPSNLHISPPQVDHKEEKSPLGESNTSIYNTPLMEDAANYLRAVANYFGLPVNVARKALEDAAANTARETTTRAHAQPRLKWENDRREDEDPAHFAARAYADEIEAGTLHRGIIGKEDPALHRKLNNWLRTHNMPKGIDIPTKPEWMTRRIAEFGKPPSAAKSEEARLHEAARYRAAKVARTTPHY